MDNNEYDFVTKVTFDSFFWTVATLLIQTEINNTSRNAEHE